ncbi:hypothetical protein [Streptomyces bauhiniae]
MNSMLVVPSAAELDADFADSAPAQTYAFHRIPDGVQAESDELNAF